jgi:hypothetical protein
VYLVIKKIMSGHGGESYNSSTQGHPGGRGKRISSLGQPRLHETLSQKTKQNKKTLKKIQRWRGKLDHDKILTFHSGKSIDSM